MSTNFKIAKHRESDNLHLKLIGEFNDTAICKLIDVLNDNCNTGMKVTINTSNLNNVSASVIGRDVFHRNITNLNDNSVSVQFIGESDSNIMSAAAVQ